MIIVHSSSRFGNESIIKSISFAVFVINLAKNFEFSPGSGNDCCGIPASINTCLYAVLGERENVANSGNGVGRELCCNKPILLHRFSACTFTAS
ncbi:hypothetical protein DERP_005248 [Dermatophagoides pteronyssinus]|uniref:Uncharacterized protein n=1 Tax=Dermatophagoides pteronyssinus TaxID=6956 RepID=A0ABQ8JM32_DERPT|nr:hypothetical protein DERP_005248 [Dermatophagoides pteronyssinus]